MVAERKLIGLNHLLAVAASYGERPPRRHPTYVKAADFAGMPEYQLKASGRPMVEYQVYILADGDRIKRREDIFCKDDEAAKKRARQMVDGHAVELWQATRKIARFAPDDGRSTDT